MPKSLDVPPEILTLVLGQLDLSDLLHFCSTCQDVRRAFGPEKLGQLLKEIQRCLSLHEDEPCSCEQLIPELSYLMCNWALLYIASQNNITWHGYGSLFRKGASFATVPHGGLLDTFFFKFGPGPELSFLLEHGASFDTIRGGVHRVLETTLQFGLVGRHTDYLLAHGASLRHGPTRVESLLDWLIRSGDSWSIENAVEFILTHGGPLRFVRHSLKRYLIKLYHQDAFSDKMDMLVQYIPNALLCIIEHAAAAGDIGPAFTRWLDHGAKARKMKVNGTSLESLIKEGGSLKDIGPEALYRAAATCDLDLITILLERGVPAKATCRGGMTALHVAAIRGNCKVQNYLLRHGANPSQATDTGVTPLHIAARFGNPKSIKILISQGGDLIAKTLSDGNTPLNCAILSRSVENVAALLEAGADATILDGEGWTTVHNAAWDGAGDILKLLVENGQDPDAESEDIAKHVCRPLHRTPLHAACQRGNHQIVETLKGYGVDLNKKDICGFTALHLAAEEGSEDIAVSLLDGGADVDAEADGGLTPLHLASDHGKYQVVEVLKRYGAHIHKKNASGFTALHLAAQHDSEDIVACLLEGGADVNNLANDQSTPLHVACAVRRHSERHNGVIQLLIDRETNIEAEKNDGGTALSLAAATGQNGAIQSLLDQDAQIYGRHSPVFPAANNGRSDALQILIERGASEHVTNTYGEGPLHLAASRGFVRVVKILLRESVAVDAVGADGITALHNAVLGNHLECVRWLLNGGANPNTQTKNGELTPLYCAAMEGLLPIAELLVQHRANINAPVCHQDTPLHAAAQNGKLDIVEFLLERHVEINPLTNNKETPLYLAAANGHLEVVKALLDHGALYATRTVSGATAIGAAVENDRLGVVELLADLNPAAFRDRRDDFNRTPLHWAIYRGLSRIAKALIDRGFDRTVVDGYGRTALEWLCPTIRPALEWAHMNPVSSNQPNIASCEVTAETNRQTALQKSVFDVSTRLLQSNRSTEKPGFHELGRCLMFLQETDDANFCYQQQILDVDEDGAVFHNATCSGCDTDVIKGSRFVCSICPDLDLCADCHNSAIERPPTCRAHQFLEISKAPRGSSKEDLGSKTISPEVRTWLEQLASRYRS